MSERTKTCEANSYHIKTRQNISQPILCWPNLHPPIEFEMHATCPKRKQNKTKEQNRTEQNKNKTRQKQRNSCKNTNHNNLRKNTSCQLYLLQGSHTSFFIFISGIFSLKVGAHYRPTPDSSCKSGMKSGRCLAGPHIKCRVMLDLDRVRNHSISSLRTQNIEVQAVFGP